MSAILNKALSVKPPISEINMKNVDYNVTQYLNGNEWYVNNPQYKKIAEAAQALQEALALERYHAQSITTTLMPIDAGAFDKAISLFNNGSPHVAFGIKKNNIPREASVGDFVTVNYTALNEEAAVYGKVINVIEYPLGWGLVIDPYETLHSFNIQQPDGWRYLSLWVAKDPTGQSGFITSKTNRYTR